MRAKPLPALVPAASGHLGYGNSRSTQLSFLLLKLQSEQFETSVVLSLLTDRLKGGGHGRATVCMDFAHPPSTAVPVACTPPRHVRTGFLAKSA